MMDLLLLIKTSNSYIITDVPDFFPRYSIGSEITFQLPTKDVMTGIVIGIHASQVLNTATDYVSNDIKYSIDVDGEYYDIDEVDITEYIPETNELSGDYYEGDI
jgi:hypothetical protein